MHIKTMQKKYLEVVKTSPRISPQSYIYVDVANPVQKNLISVLSLYVAAANTEHESHLSPVLMWLWQIQYKNLTSVLVLCGCGKSSNKRISPQSCSYVDVANPVNKSYSPVLILMWLLKILYKNLTSFPLLYGCGKSSTSQTPH